MKKILSLILALSLIISVAPMSFADDVAGEPVDKPGMYFNFGAAGYGSETDIPAADIIANGDSTTPTFASVGTDPWYIDGQRCINGYVLTSATPDTAAYPQAKASALHWNVVRSYIGKSNNKAQAAFVIKLKINETGVFTPSVKVGTRKDATTYLFTLAPVSVVDRTYKFTASSGSATLGDVSITNNPPMTYAVAGNPEKGVMNLGTVACYSSTIGEKTVDFNPIEITQKGEYFLYVAGTGRGSAANSSSINYNMNLHSFNLTPVPATELADDAFTAAKDETYTAAPASATVNTLALYGEASEAIGTETVTYGETATIDAVPATVTKADGTYNFLYWAKGLEEGVSKQILSTSNAAFAYKPHEGANYLIAVYEKEGEANEAFYNNNGQLLTDLKIVDGVLPALPAMAGRGNAAAWVQRGTNDEFAGGAAAPTSGDMVFMAKYEEVEDNITINGESYSYGDIVSCKDIVAGMDNFSYFTRKIGDADAEIISIDADYSFAAYTDCTIEAVCNGEVTEEALGRVARKILMSTFSVGNQTAVMAEFIGFDGAKEKGIMFGTKKIAMTTDYAQFTVTNDTADAVTVTGYAIVGDEKYTDGSISVAGVSAE